MVLGPSHTTYMGIDLTPLIAFIYINLDPAVTQNCVPLLQTKHLLYKLKEWQLSEAIAAAS